jgi:hypothetical protein
VNLENIFREVEPDNRYRHVTPSISTLHGESSDIATARGSVAVHPNMTAPDHMRDDGKGRLHEPGHPHMEPPTNPGRFSWREESALERSPHACLLRHWKLS